MRRKKQQLTNKLFFLFPSPTPCHIFVEKNLKRETATNGSSSPRRYLSSPGFRSDYEPVSGGHQSSSPYPPANTNGSGNLILNNNNNGTESGLRYSNHQQQPTYDIPVGRWRNLEALQPLFPSLSIFFTVVPSWSALNVSRVADVLFVLLILWSAVGYRPGGTLLVSACSA